MVVVGVGHRMPAKGEDEQKAARVPYVVVTRATHRRVVTASSNAGFCKRLGAWHTTTQ